MDGDSPEVESLRKRIQAASTELTIAIALHENWKICASDPDLHARLGQSYASGAFVVIRNALRRETVLALMRMWDNSSSGALSLNSVGKLLNDKRVIAAVEKAYEPFWDSPELVFVEYAPAEERGRFVQGFTKTEVHLGIKKPAELREKAKQASALIAAYDKGGSQSKTLRFLKTMRDQHFAHRQLNPADADVGAPDNVDEAVENFYQDMLKLLGLLWNVLGIPYRPEVASSVHLREATFFWLSVRGERTEGHPSYDPAFRDER